MPCSWQDSVGAWEIPGLLFPSNWGAGWRGDSLLPHSPASAPCATRCRVTPVRVCRQGPLCLQCLPRRDHSPSASELSGYKYRGVAWGDWAKAQPDTTSPSFTVTFCQMPVGRGVAYLLAHVPVTFTALARCLPAVFTLIYSSLLCPHLCPPRWYWRGADCPTQVPLGWEGWEGAGTSPWG